MKETLHFTIRTPGETLFTGVVKQVRVTTMLGKMVIKPGHADLVGSVGYTSVKVRAEDQKDEETFIARNGMLHISNDKNSAELLVLDCHKTKELSLTTAKEYLAFVEEQLKQGNDMSQFQLRFIKDEKYMLETQITDLESN